MPQNQTNTKPQNNPTAELHKQLKFVLADSYALYLKTQNYHWNVTGQNFPELHRLFEEQYKELAEAIDLIAERIRAVGETAPGGFKAFLALTSIEDGNETHKSLAMVKDLHQSHKQVVATLKKTLAAAHQADDETTADLMIQRITAHEKSVWMLGASAE
jgi:starvation-inducible DNA-binding protein